MLSIRLLGAPHITYADQPVTLARRKSRALLYYLAAHPAPVARDHLLAFFWPDADRQGAQQNLRTTLYGLRKVLDDLLQVDDDSLGLTAAATVDVRTFTAQLAQPTVDLATLQQTLALYRGDFLNDFTLPDLPEFDDWASIERERYRRLAMTGYTRLGHLFEAQQAYRDALHTLERSLSLEPLQEDVQRDALRLHYLAGDRAGAIRRYEQLRELLAEEMGVPPMEETQALYDAIITDTLPPPPIRPPVRPSIRSLALTAPAMPDVIPLPRHGVQTRPFVGRQAELQKLHELTTSHQLLLIEGEGGIGKSRLVEEYIENQQQSGTGQLVLLGQAHELEATLPYQPLLEAFRKLFIHPYWSRLAHDLALSPLWRAEVARLLPELAAADDPRPLATAAVDELRLWEGISQFVLALARQLPVLLAFDDLHWADSSTIGLLGYLLRKAAQQQANITFVATAQPVVAPAPLTLLLDALLREARLRRFPLQRLTPSEITQLATQSHLYNNAAVATWLTELSEGNPFILIELLHYVHDHHLLLPDSRTDLAEHAAIPIVPQTVYALIRARLARLSETSRQVLNVASVIGREFEIETVARTVSPTAALSDASVLAGLDELQNAGLIQPLTGLRYRFDHQLTLEVAYQEMGEPRHRLLHRRVAEALEEIYRKRLDTVAGLLTHHFAEGHSPEKVALYGYRAGQQAAKLAAWREAIAFYEQAAAAAAAFTDQSQYQLILAALGEACLHAGRSGRAIEALRLALSLESQSTQPVAQELLYANLIEGLMLGTRYAELLTLVEQINGHAAPETASFVEYFRGLALTQMGGDVDTAVLHLQKAEAMLSQSPPEDTATKGVVTLGDVKFELGNIAARRGDLPTAIAYFRATFAVSQPMNTDRALRIHILACNNLAYHLHLQGDPSAVDYAQRGLALAQERGALSVLPYLYSTLGEIALARQALDEADQHFQEGLTLAKQFAAAERVAGLTANLGLVAKARGDTESARHLLFTALEQTEALQIRYPAAQIRLWLAPLLAADAGHAQLAQARQIAVENGFHQVLTEVDRLENELL